MRAGIHLQLEISKRVGLHDPFVDPSRDPSAHSLVFTECLDVRCGCILGEYLEALETEKVIAPIREFQVDTAGLGRLETPEIGDTAGYRHFRPTPVTAVGHIPDLGFERIKVPQMGI